ncbi:MAG: Holliday junction resolvase RuvX [Kiritimatiellia bacterium]
MSEPASVILGIDYGERRIGFAISDPEAVLAFPLKIVEVRSPGQAARETATICRERKVERIVVGLPFNMNGTRGEMASRVEEFAKLLASMVRVPIDLWDERLSTRLVERNLIALGVNRQGRKRVTDKFAAQVMLQSYLDARRERTCHGTD